MQWMWKWNWDLDFWRTTLPPLPGSDVLSGTARVYYINATMHINTTNSHLRWWRPERVSRILEMKKYIVKKLVIQKHFTIRIFLITIIVLGDSYQHYEQQLKILFNIQWNLNPSFLKISWRKNSTWMKMTVAGKAIMCHKHQKKMKVLHFDLGIQK